MSQANSNIEVFPKQNFKEGVSLGINFATGEEGKNRINQKVPSELRENYVTFSLELRLQSADNGKQVLETLEGLKSMALGMVPPLEDFMNNGLSVEFRHVGTSVFVDVSCNDKINQMVPVQTYLEQYLALVGMSPDALKKQDGSLSGSMRLATGIHLDKLLTATFDELLDMATSVIFTSEGSINNLLSKSSVKSLVNTLASVLPMKEKNKFVLDGLLVFLAFKKFELTSEYDREEMKYYIKDLASRMVHNMQGGASMDELNPEIGQQIISSNISQFQEMGQTQLEGFKGIILSFLEPYLESIKVLNLDQLNFSLSVPMFSLNLGVELCLDGLTNFAKDNLLN